VLATLRIGNARGVMAFTIEFSPDAHDHLRVLRKWDQRIVVDAIADQLAHQPDQPTAHRKAAGR
jgi:hypothetical protein